MTPPMTAAQSPFNTSFETAAARQEPIAQPVPMGTYYIHNAAPMKGARPGADGKCMYVLECFPVEADATPGQIAARAYKPDEARYMVYHGHMSRHKGDAGLVVGYVYECAGSNAFANVSGDDSMRGPIMTQAKMMPVRRPQTTFDPAHPHFGPAASFIQTTAEEIATLNAIDAIRSPRNESRRRPNFA